LERRVLADAGVVHDCGQVAPAERIGVIVSRLEVGRLVEVYGEPEGGPGAQRRGQQDDRREYASPIL
jgi:hypothetical protein